jgi:hypothetical protein
VADLAGRDEVVERPDRLVDRDRRVGAVRLVDVDVVDAESAQAVVDRPHDPASRVAAAALHAIDRVVELGAQHDVVASTGDRLTDDRLVLAVGIHVGGVDQVDAGVERPVDDAETRITIAVAPRPKHHGAQPQPADKQSGSAERARLHRPTSTRG